jgi:hypothetical protein
MRKIKVTLSLNEECLGLCPPTDKLLEEFIAQNAPDAPSREEEIAAYKTEKPADTKEAIKEMVKREMSIFMRDDDGAPYFWDYQLRGFMKDQCGMLNRAEDTLSSKLTAFRKTIDGLIFVRPRKVRIELPTGGKIGSCHRPLRISTATGDRTAIAASETVPAGSTISFEVHYMPLKDAKLKIPTKKAIADAAKAGLPEPKPMSVGGLHIPDLLREWLEHGEYRGLGQWRNSGKGTFTVVSFEELP